MCGVRWSPAVKALAGSMRRCILLDRLLPNALLLRFTLSPCATDPGKATRADIEKKKSPSLAFDLEGTLRIGGEFLGHLHATV